MVKVQKTKRGQFFITVPEYIITTLKLSKGSEVNFLLDLKRGEILLKKEGEVNSNGERK
jgi:bifunctional DNA-binding transcriptional regulator/antitoxin component of YhaV-PrlF toxin-antitoxin module